MLRRHSAGSKSRTEAGAPRKPALLTRMSTVPPVPESPCAIELGSETSTAANDTPGMFGLRRSHEYFGVGVPQLLGDRPSDSSCAASNNRNPIGKVVGDWHSRSTEYVSREPKSDSREAQPQFPVWVHSYVGRKTIPMARVVLAARGDSSHTLLI